MFFLAKDKRIEITDLVLTDNLSMYHSVITFVSPAKLYTHVGKIEFSNTSDKLDVCIESQQLMDNGLMKISCTTKKVHDTFDSITAGYNGRTTLNSLFAKLGFDYHSDFKSNNTYFSIPQCKVVTMFDNLTKYASFANGGGAHFYMQSDGVIYGYDYKLIKAKARATKIDGQIQGESSSIDWTNNTTSEYELFVYDNNNNFKKETFVIEKGFGRAAVPVCDTTGLTKDAFKQELTNLFYNKWFSAHRVSVGITEQVKLGDLVDLNGLGNTYIVKGITMSYTETQKTPAVTAELVSNPIFE